MKIVILSQTRRGTLETIGSWKFTLAFLQPLFLALTLSNDASAADAGAPTYYAGVVVDSKGVPVTGATVQSYRDSSTVTASGARDFALKEQRTTDREGCFTVSTGGGVIILVVKKDGLANGWRRLSSVLDESDEPVVLTSPTILAGTVSDENGRPIAGAEVWVSAAMPTLGAGGAQRSRLLPSALALRRPVPEDRGFSLAPLLMGKPARDCFSVHSDAEGRFRIPNFPTGAQAALGAYKPGKAQPVPAKPSETLPYTSGRQNIKLTLVPAANIEGKVIVAATGQPLSGVKLRWMATNDLRNPVLSGADGSFRLTDIAPGNAVLTAVFPGEPLANWVAEDVPVNLAPGESRKDVLVRALKGGVAAISVSSKDERKPLGNVPVSAYSRLSGSFTFGVTGPDGVAQLRLLPDEWQISADAGDRNSYQPMVKVVTGQTNRTEVVVDVGLLIKGTVRDPEGVPVSGAVISLGIRPQARTDAQGRYELRWQPPRRMMDVFGGENLKLLARDVERNLAVVRDLDERTNNLDLTLHPCITLSARVVDAHAAPITNALGEAHMITRSRGYGDLGTKPISSDALGRLEIPSLPQADGYSISVSAKGYGSVFQQMQAPVPPTNHIEFPTIILPLADQTLAGVVVDADNQPVAGATVQLFGLSQPFSRAQTDSRGHFSFDAVCAGDIHLNVSSLGSYQAAQPVAGDTNVVLRLNTTKAAREDSTRKTAANTGARITGTVRDTSGAPAAGVRLRIWDDYINRDEAETDSDGRYSLNVRKQNGRSTPVMVARDPERNLVASREVDETITNLDLELQPGLTLSARVQDEQGKPLPTAMETLIIRLGNSGWPFSEFPVRADDQGLIEVKALPRGFRYSITITSRGYSVVRAEAPAEETYTTRFEFPATVLKVADHILAGQMLDPGGNPVSGANVYLSGFGQLDAQTTTDAQGRFTFDGLCEGMVQLFASSSSMGTHAGVQVGDTNVVIRVPPYEARGWTPEPVVTRQAVTNSGRVLDVSGAPLAWARLSIVPAFGEKFEANSDADGKYSLTWQKQRPGIIEVPRFLCVRDEEHNLVATRDVDQTAANVDLRLTPGLTLAVRVRDADGKPIPTATATLCIWAGVLQPEFDRVTAKADDEGLIELRALPQGRHYGMTISAAGYGSASLEAQNPLTETTRFEFPSTVLSLANRKLTGQVLFPDGKPIPGADVIVAGDLLKGAQTKSDAQGRFAFYGLGQSPARLIANLMGVGSGSTAVPALATNANVWFGIDGLNYRDAQLVTTSGTVFDLFGSPVSGASLSLMPDLGEYMKVKSYAYGKYSFTWQDRNPGPPRPGFSVMPTARYVLLGRDAERQLVSAVEIDEKSTQVDLHLEPGLTLSGSVRGDDGQPVAHATVQLVLYPPDARRSTLNRLPSAEANAQGTFSISALPQGAPYLVQVSAPGYGTNGIAVPAKDTRASEVQLPPIIVKLANRQVAGHVLDPDGEPSPGAHVVVRGEGQPGTKDSHADSSGYFVIQQICDGPVEVRAFPAGSGSARISGTVQAHGGDTNLFISVGAR